MSKKENGITLVALIITVIVLLILAGISISVGTSSIDEIRDDKTETELSMVQQAIIQEYTLLLSEGKDGITATKITSNVSLSNDELRPDNLIGTRIASVSTLTTYGFTDYKNDYSNKSTMCYEDYYYLLTMDDLVTLGIEKEANLSDDSESRNYIVNYSTGEVFDITNKTYIVSQDEIYLDGTDSEVKEQTYDFSDNTDDTDNTTN